AESARVGSGAAFFSTGAAGAAAAGAAPPEAAGVSDSAGAPPWPVSSARRAWARLSRCSGISVTVVLRRADRCAGREAPGDAATLGRARKGGPSRMVRGVGGDDQDLGCVGGGGDR